MAKDSRGGKRTTQEVDFDSWGEVKGLSLIKRGDEVVGTIQDVHRYEMTPDVRPITKKAILEDVDAWRMDDGTYGDADTAIYFAYNDGAFVNAEDLEGKPYKKKGLVGVSISTADYESVWGGEINKRTGRLELWKTWSEDGNSGYSNSYSGYKVDKEWLERVKTTYGKRGNDGKMSNTTRQVIRRSTKKQR